MSKSSIGVLLLLALIGACKSASTNPEQGQKLRLITSDQDTVYDIYGPVVFSVTVLDGTGYGVQGAYIDFYDPIEQRARHEGPTPENGQWLFTDTIPNTIGGGDFEFAFVAQDAGAITSDSLRLWIHKQDLSVWIIDSIAANSVDADHIGVTWSRPAIDSGTDTVFVHAQSGGAVLTFLVPFPLSSATVSASRSGPDTVTVHNEYTSSRPVVWAPANYSPDITLYESTDSNGFDYPGLWFEQAEAVPMDEINGYRPLAELMLVTDPNNHQSGVTIISPSLSSLSGFSSGQITALYHPVQFIDSGSNLHEFYYSNDLSTYVTGVTPLYSIPLPDSGKYSTAFIAVTQSGHYAQVCVGPVTRDWNNDRFVNVSLLYQATAGLPYATAHPKASAKH